MVPIAMVVTLVGYGVLFAGIQEWSGCPWSWTGIFWPGGTKFTPCKGSTASGGAGSGSGAAKVPANQLSGNPPGTNSTAPPTAYQIGGGITGFQP